MKTAPSAHFLLEVSSGATTSGRPGGGEAVNRALCQHIQGPVHADKGCERGRSDGPEW